MFWGGKNMNSDNFVYADVLMCYGFEGKEPLCKPYILNDVLFKLDENHFISLKHVKKERDLIRIRKKFKNIYPSQLSGLIYNLEEIYEDKN